MSVNWIPISDQLPDSDLSVLIACPEENDPVWMGYHDGEGWFSVDGIEIAGVTHWADLPDPPPVNAVSRKAKNPCDFAKGDIITDGRSEYEVIEPDKRGMAKLKNLKRSVTEDWNACNNRIFRKVTPAPAGGGN